MATIGTRGKPRVYKRGSKIFLNKENDRVWASSSNSYFDLGGGNDALWLWGNGNTVATSGGIDKLALFGNGNVVRAQGSDLKSTVYFLGDQNFFFNDFNMAKKSEKLKVVFEEGIKQTVTGANLNIEWKTKYLPDVYGYTLNLKANYSSFKGDHGPINVLGGTENSFLGTNIRVTLHNAKSKVYLSGAENALYSGNQGCVAIVDGTGHSIFMRGESDITINGSSNRVFNENQGRKNLASKIVVNGNNNEIIDSVTNHLGALDIEINSINNSFVGQNSNIYLNGTVDINSKAVAVRIADAEKNNNNPIAIKLRDGFASYIEVLRTQYSKTFGIEARNEIQGDLVRLIGEIEYGQKGSEGGINFVSLHYKNNVVGRVNYDSGDKISVNGTWVTW